MLRMLRFCFCLPLTLANAELDFEADQCEPGDESCRDLSLRQLRVEKLKAMQEDEEAKPHELLQSEASDRWYVGLAHGGMWTGGTCWWHGCDASRGAADLPPAIISDASAKMAMSQRAASATHPLRSPRHTWAFAERAPPAPCEAIEEMCIETRYCEESQGPAMCLEGNCFCLEGSVFQNGKCQEPGSTEAKEVSSTSGEMLTTTEEPEDEEEEEEVDPDCGIPKAGSDCFKKVPWTDVDGCPIWQQATW
eukprot:s4891_g7.t1